MELTVEFECYLDSMSASVPSRDADDAVRDAADMEPEFEAWLNSEVASKEGFDNEYVEEDALWSAFVPYWHAVEELPAWRSDLDTEGVFASTGKVSVVIASDSAGLALDEAVSVALSTWTDDFTVRAGGVQVGSGVADVEVAATILGVPTSTMSEALSLIQKGLAAARRSL